MARDRAMIRATIPSMRPVDLSLTGRMVVIAASSSNGRLSKDYEELVEASESMIYLAMTNLMIRRLCPA